MSDQKLELTEKQTDEIDDLLEHEPSLEEVIKAVTVPDPFDSGVATTITTRRGQYLTAEEIEEFAKRH